MLRPEKLGKILAPPTSSMDSRLSLIGSYQVASTKLLQLSRCS